MRNGKAAGRDNIAAELLKADVEIAATELEDLFEVIWNTETIPGDWTKGIIVMSQLGLCPYVKECSGLA